MSYPPSYSDGQELFEELKLLDSTTNDEFNQRKYVIIHDLAEARFLEARPYFVAGLENPDPDYRWACISALATHWQDTEPRFIAKLLDMARNDPDTQVRMIAIDSLGRLKVRVALTVLKRIVENEDEDPFHRQMAYEAILRILGCPSEAFPVWPGNFDAKLIDRKLLGTISSASDTSESK